MLHTVTRLKSIPGLRDSAEMPEAERTRGAVLADRLTVPTLARAWQMLLKGVGEVETAPDRRAAAEMVLIRLCHVSDMPPPGDLVRRLSAGGVAAAVVRVAADASPGGVVSMAPSGGGMTRAVANGAPMAQGFVETVTEGPRLASFRDVAALVKDQREAMLHAHLLHSTHLVRFAPPVIELRTQPEAPRDLAPKLAALLSNATGTRWTIALSTAAGEPTLAEQGNAADVVRREEAADHPLIRAIWRRFPARESTRCVTVTLTTTACPLASPRCRWGSPRCPTSHRPTRNF